MYELLLLINNDDIVDTILIQPSFKSLPEGHVSKCVRRSQTIPNSCQTLDFAKTRYSPILKFYEAIFLKMVPALQLSETTKEIISK